LPALLLTVALLPLPPLPPPLLLLLLLRFSGTVQIWPPRKIQSSMNRKERRKKSCVQPCDATHQPPQH
jgi:hypothetical protein